MTTAGKFGFCCGCCVGNKSEIYVDLLWTFNGFPPYSGVTEPQTTIYQTETIDYSWLDTDCTTSHTAQRITTWSRVFPDSTKLISLSTSCDGTVYSSSLPDSANDGVRTDYFNPAIFDVSNHCVTTTPCIQCVGTAADVRWGSGGSCAGAFHSTTVINSSTSKTITLNRNSGGLLVGTAVYTLSDPVTLSDLESDANDILALFDFTALPISINLNYSGSSTTVLSLYRATAGDTCYIGIVPGTGGAVFGGRGGLNLSTNSWSLNPGPPPLPDCSITETRLFASRRLYGGGHFPASTLQIQLSKSFIPSGAPGCCHVLFPQAWETYAFGAGTIGPNYYTCDSTTLGFPSEFAGAPDPTCYLAAPHTAMQTIEPPSTPGVLYVGADKVPTSNAGGPITCNIPTSCCS